MKDDEKAVRGETTVREPAVAHRGPVSKDTTGAKESNVLDSGIFAGLVSLKPGQSVEYSRDSIRDLIWEQRDAASLPKGAVRGADGVLRDKDGKAVPEPVAKEVKDKDGKVVPAKADVPPTREEIDEYIAGSSTIRGIIVTRLDSGNYQFYRPIGEDTVAVEDIASLPKGTRVAISR